MGVAYTVCEREFNALCYGRKKRCISTRARIPKRKNVPMKFDPQCDSRLQVDNIASLVLGNSKGAINSAKFEERGRPTRLCSWMLLPNVLLRL